MFKVLTLHMEKLKNNPRVCYIYIYIYIYISHRKVKKTSYVDVDYIYIASYHTLKS